MSTIMSVIWCGLLIIYYAILWAYIDDRCSKSEKELKELKNELKELKKNTMLDWKEEAEE